MTVEGILRRVMRRSFKGMKFSKIRPVFPDKLDGIGWYIHMPFCRKLCPYCSFRSIRHSPDKVKPYIEAVKKEISIYRDRLGPIKIGDIYFGGGTPSLTWEGVVEIAKYIRSEFEVEGEIGLEASPEDVDETLIGALWNVGVTKVSLGVQSLDDEILRVMRRGYDAKTALKAIELLRRKGFYVSVDLMHGLTGQSIPSLLSDLSEIARTGVQQISCYPLMLFPHTRWYRDVKRGYISLPSSSLRKKMFYEICDFLSANGYRRISCWDYKHKHVAEKKYVTCGRDENIGVGLSAYTQIGGMFYVNTFFLREYIKAVETGLPVATGVEMPPDRIMRQWVMRRLYRLKIDKAEFKERFGLEIEQAMGGFLFMLRLLRLVENHPDHILVTRRGSYYTSLMTEIFMVTFPGGYMKRCLHNPWPGEFEL